MKRLTPLILLLLLLAPPALAFGPVISGISPVSGPDNGVVTITITGSGFDTLSLVRLNKCRLTTGGSSEPPFAGTVIAKSDTSITAQFNLHGKVAGSYDLSLNAPFEGREAWAVTEGAFVIYHATGPAPAVTTTAVPVTTVTTTTTVPAGENSVYFETYPPGATIFLDGEKIGTAPFVYHTRRRGTSSVACRLPGYQEYEAKVIIIEGRRVHFVAPLSVLPDETTTMATTAATLPASAATTIPAAPGTAATPPALPAPATPPGEPAAAPTKTPYPKSTITFPTPWATDPPAPQEAQVDPALAAGAVLPAIAAFVIRRRASAGQPGKKR